MSDRKLAPIWWDARSNVRESCQNCIQHLRECSDGIGDGRDRISRDVAYRASRSLGRCVDVWGSWLHIGRHVINLQLL